MGEEYNKELCEERHVNIEKAFERAFKKLGGLSNKLTGFLIVTISTLIAVIINIIMTYATNGGGK